MRNNQTNKCILDHPGKCWNEETKTSYSVGEKFVIKGSCREAVCSNPQDDVLVLMFKGYVLNRESAYIS